MIDISAVINIHAEKLVVPTSIQSFSKCCDYAFNHGIDIERIAVVDRPDDLTAEVIATHTAAFDKIETVDFGDLGASRNAGRAISEGKFLTFFDGDDLWGHEWIVRAFNYAEKIDNNELVVHPHIIYYFSAGDYLCQSQDKIAPKNARSFFFLQQDSGNLGFDPRTLLFNNIWTANCFGLQSLYERFPYHCLDRESGFGVEDWTWNIETLIAGIRHAIVPNTVHCIRLKSEGSLSAENIKTGTIPPIHRFAAKLESALAGSGKSQILGKAG